MLWTLARKAAAQDLTRSIKKFLPAQLPPALSKKPGNLFEVLSRTTTNGVGLQVYQTRWTSKQIPDSYWVITRTSIRHGGTRGKAWGFLFWKGKPTTLYAQLIPGGLKYTWAEGRSCGLPVSNSKPFTSLVGMPPENS